MCGYKKTRHGYCLKLPDGNYTIIPFRLYCGVDVESLAITDEFMDDLVDGLNTGRIKYNGVR